FACSPTCSVGLLFFFSSRRRHTRFSRDWSSDVCSSDLSPHRLERAHELVQQTRLRIPLLVGEDCIHGHSFYEGATIFPTQLGMAASWDPGLVEQAARITAVEAAATGVHWTFSPVLCIARDLRWGRV